MTTAATTGELPAHVHGRKATWFELFFDLVFVVAVAQLSSAYAHHYDWQGAASFAFAFLVMWWCWLGHSFHATRFDEDRWDQRLVGFVQILAIAWIGYGASSAFGDRAWVFVTGIAAFKVLLAWAYLREWRWRGARGLIRTYALQYLAQAALWSASLAFADATRWALWLVAFALDLASPWLVARYTHTVRPHPEHLPERFGLFTIILLGEGMASVVHALDHGESLHAEAVVAAVGGALLAFMLWVGYFEQARAHGEREVADRGAGRNLRLWAYGHVPLYLGIASLAAGTVSLSGQARVSEVAGGLFAIGITLAMVGLSLLGVASRPASEGRRRRRQLAHFGVAGAFLAAMLLLTPSRGEVLYLASFLVFAVQLLLARSAPGAA